jgi:hypothetical protein
MDFIFVCSFFLVAGIVVFAWIKYDEYKHQH